MIVKNIIPKILLSTSAAPRLIITYLGMIFSNVTLSGNVIFIYYYMPSTFYIVKLQLALGNIFHSTESISIQSHDDAKNPYWDINMDFWH